MTTVLAGPKCEECGEPTRYLRRFEHRYTARDRAAARHYALKLHPVECDIWECSAGHWTHCGVR